jgi:transposase
VISTPNPEALIEPLAKELENGDLAFTISGDPRYSFSEHLSDYANIHQKGVVFHSQMMHDRQEKTFEKNLEKDREKARISLKRSPLMSLSANLMHL